MKEQVFEHKKLKGESPMPRYMTVREVAEVFRKSSKTIYRWVEEGKVFREVVRVNDGVLIPEREVKRIIEEGQEEYLRV